MLYEPKLSLLSIGPKFCPGIPDFFYETSPRVWDWKRPILFFQNVLVGYFVDSFESGESGRSIESPFFDVLDRPFSRRPGFVILNFQLLMDQKKIFKIFKNLF